MKISTGDLWPPKKVKALRLRLGLSMEKFARSLGVSYMTVYRWEHGKAEPSTMGRAILRLFDITTAPRKGA